MPRGRATHLAKESSPACSPGKRRRSVLHTPGKNDEGTLQPTLCNSTIFLYVRMGDEPVGRPRMKGRSGVGPNALMRLATYDATLEGRARPAFSSLLLGSTGILTSSPPNRGCRESRDAFWQNLGCPDAALVDCDPDPVELRFSRMAGGLPGHHNKSEKANTNRRLWKAAVTSRSSRSSWRCTLSASFRRCLLIAGTSSTAITSRSGNETCSNLRCSTGFPTAGSAF